MTEPSITEHQSRGGSLGERVIAWSKQIPGLDPHLCIVNHDSVPLYF